MSNFKVGQRVVCVDDVPRYNTPMILEKGRVYTVRAIGDGGEGLLLWELVCPLTGGFYADRFRPIIEDLTASLARTENERIIEERPEHVNEPQPA